MPPSSLTYVGNFQGALQRGGEHSNNTWRPQLAGHASVALWQALVTTNRSMKRKGEFAGRTASCRSALPATSSTIAHAARSAMLSDAAAVGLLHMAAALPAAAAPSALTAVAACSPSRVTSAPVAPTVCSSPWHPGLALASAPTAAHAAAATCAIAAPLGVAT